MKHFNIFHCKGVSESNKFTQGPKAPPPRRNSVKLANIIEFLWIDYHLSVIKIRDGLIKSKMGLGFS